MGILNVAVAFLLALLAGLGVGSGGLYVIFLSEVLGISHHIATSANLLFFVAAMLSAVVLHIRKGRLDYPFLLQIILFGAPGAYLGALLAGLLPASVLRIVLGIFLILSGVLSICGKQRAKSEEK